MQKNALFFIFFATPSGLSSFFAFWGLSFSSIVFSAALLCRLFLITLCSNDIFVSLTACCHGSRPCLFSFRFLLSGLRCRQITAALSSLHVRTLLSRIAPCLCIMFCTRLQTPAVCPIQDKCGCSLCGGVVFVVYAGLYPAYSKGEPLRSPFHYQPLLAMLIFLHALILFHGLRGDSGRGFRAVAYLRVGRARADRAPSLAAGQTHSHTNSDY